MGRGAEFNDRVKEARRKTILETAVKLFAVNGLAGTKISRIASDAGMSQGLMYHYFRSKEEIYVALIRHAFSRMNTAVRALEALPVTAREKIETAIVQLLHGFDASEASGYYHLLIAQATASQAIPDAAAAIIERQGKVPYQVMARIIADGQAKGELCNHDPDELALVFWTTIKGLALHRVTHGSGVKMPDPDMLMKIFL